MPDFSVLTLNTFGLPFLLGYGRIARLATLLDNWPVDVCCLQEIQQQTYIGLLAKKLQQYPHLAFSARRWAPRGGLLTVSRPSFLRQHFIAFNHRGHPRGAGFADWLLEKGVLLTTYQLAGQEIVLLNTHLQANYGAQWTPDDRLAQVQQAQVNDLIALVQAQSPQALVVLLGDFNFPRETFLYHHLITKANLFDPLGNDPRPTYRPLPFVSAKWLQALDFVLLRWPAQPEFTCTADIVSIADKNSRFSARRFLTDHSAVTLRLSWPDTQLS